MAMKYTAVITKEGSWYVAHCIELGVVSQGTSIPEAQANLKEAVDLYIESFAARICRRALSSLLYPIEVSVVPKCRSFPANS